MGLSMGGMIKIDKHYVDKRVRWCPGDNKLYGVCYEHSHNHDLSLDSWDDVMRLKQAVDDEEIHITKECMVIALGYNAININAHPVVVWQTCSKDEVSIQMKVIQGLSDSFLKLNGTPLMCWSTDGDSTSRQIFDTLMQHKLPETHRIYHIISTLRFMDITVGKHAKTDLTVNLETLFFIEKMSLQFLSSPKRNLKVH